MHLPKPIVLPGCPDPVLLQLLSDLRKRQREVADTQELAEQRVLLVAPLSLESETQSPLSEQQQPSEAVVAEDGGEKRGGGGDFVGGGGGE